MLIIGADRNLEFQAADYLVICRTHHVIVSTLNKTTSERIFAVAVDDKTKILA